MPCLKCFVSSFGSRSSGLSLPRCTFCGCYWGLFITAIGTFLPFVTTHWLLVSFGVALFITSCSVGLYIQSCPQPVDNVVHGWLFSVLVAFLFSQTFKYLWYFLEKILVDGGEVGYYCCLS